MKKSRFSEEQIIGFLKQAEAGIPIKELCRNGGFSDATFYKWRAKPASVDVKARFFKKVKDAALQALRSQTPPGATQGISRWCPV